jgi:hypothetical protein
LRSNWSLAIEYVIQRRQSFPSVVEGTVARDFQLQVFVKKSLRYSQLKVHVSLTPVANGKYLQSDSFNYFVLTPLDSKVYI